MFNKDSVWTGILIGMLMPVALYGLLYGGLVLYRYIAGNPNAFNASLLLLVSPVVNLFFIRYYFVNRKFDDTGRGLLLVTFIYVIAYFVIY